MTITNGLLAGHSYGENQTSELLNRNDIVQFFKKHPLQNLTSTTIDFATVNLQHFDFENNIAQLLPAHFAERYRTVPLMLLNGYLIVAIAKNTTDLEDIKNIEFITGHRVETFTTSSQDIDTGLEYLYGIRTMLGFSQQESSSHAEEDVLAAIRQQMESKPIVQLATRIIHEAVRRKASDIHLRPSETSLEYLLRIDGTLVSCAKLDKQHLCALISRFKIMGNMDISEHRLPQDGGAKLNIGNRMVEVRMSIMPTVNGESLVVRLLNSDACLHKMEQIGFGEREYDVLLKSIHQSNGLVLVTGPTGAGKSTSLYALLQEIKKNSGLNIMTVEDPVEFHIEGIEQIQINPKTGYTFARALRNILRHDPDVIMIGEIRDEETAKIAIECALTGHLVLSTLHAIDSASAVTRLLEMGIKPYLLKSTLSAVVAQRLVKLNCPHCHDTDSSNLAQRLSSEPTLKDIAWQSGKGCDHCDNIGLKGRKGIYEVLHIDQDVSNVIHEGISEKAILAAAAPQQMQTLASNAQAMAMSGDISAEEFVRLKIC